VSVRALLFDVDGTLADTEEAHWQSFNDAFQAEGIGWHWSRERYAELLKTTGGKERIAAHLHSLDLPASQRSRLEARIGTVHRLKTDFYTRRVRAGGIELREGIRRLIVEARSAGVRLAIASTATRESVDALLTTALAPDAPDWFAVIATGDVVCSKKPAPDIYEFALAVLELRADECIAFEDSGRGLSAARAARLFTVVTPTYWTRDDNFGAASLLLPRLGDPDAALDADSAARVGNSMLTLADLARLHALRGSAVARNASLRDRASRRARGHHYAGSRGR
jgi:HAD superfamily hydrolase (TIGR01509 family)